MNKNKLKVWRFILTFLIVGMATAVLADKFDVRQLESNGDIMKLGQVMERISEKLPGRILEVELDKEAGNYVYEIELIDQKGVIWELEIDARSGELLKKQKE